MHTRIAVDCLTCGHSASIGQDELPSIGLAEDTPLVVLTKRLTCRTCGSGSVRAFRYVEDEEAPPLIPRG
ncbi:MAG: hypothetical protein HXY30_04455 [Pseudorhodoplanes sp.]|nr:hypothetical protein [Pseudorhodoplanes sp.]